MPSSSRPVLVPSTVIVVGDAGSAAAAATPPVSESPAMATVANVAATRRAGADTDADADARATAPVRPRDGGRPSCS
jgi:hypothetical protein